MTTFNTGNPVGSSDPRDLYDNAENADFLINGDQAAYNDRTGASRKSWTGVEQQVAQQATEFAADQASRETTFANFLSSSGFEYLGTYGAGVTFTEYNQYVVDAGEAWFIDPTTPLPYTTTGAGVPEGGALMSRGEALLRQELGSGIRRVDSLAGLQAISGRFAGDVAYMVGRTSAGDGGEGEFRWDASDLSATLVLASVTSTLVDDTTDTITKTAHGLVNGIGVITTTVVNGLSANQVYWVVNASTDTFQLSAAFGGAAVDLTGTTNFTVYRLLDPLQGVYVTGSGDPTGVNGCWLRSLASELHLGWFGVVGDGVSDDTSAFQSAVHGFGQTHEIVGLGNIRVTDTISYITSGDAPGLRLKLSPGSTITADFTGEGSFPEGQPIISLFGATTPYQFQRNGLFTNVRLRMAAGASNVSGIQTVGAWDYVLDGCSIRGLDGNGIYIPDRTDLDANPDAWASVKWTLRDTEIMYCLDGIQSQAGQGAAGWQLYDCYIVSNKRNGVLADASAWRYVGGAYAFNGTAGAGSGIKYEKHLGGTPTNAYIDQCEIDSNYDSGFEADEIGFIEINRGRFISKYDTIHPMHTAQQSHIKVTASCLGAKLTHNFHRLDSGLTVPITLYDFGVPSLNKASIEINDYAVQNDFGATVIDATDGALASRNANTVRKAGSANAKNNDFRNFVYAGSAATGLSLTSTESTLNFSNNSVAQTGWGGTHNDLTGEITAPYDGHFEVSGLITVDDISAGAELRVRILINGVAADESYYVPAAAASRHTLKIGALIQALEGDIITIVARATGVGTNTLSRTNYMIIKAL